MIQFYIPWGNWWNELIWVTGHCNRAVTFLEDKHSIVMHLSIFYEYQQFSQHLICFSIQPQLQLVDLHRNLNDTILYPLGKLVERAYLGHGSL
jgi:hypothetical protein